jgi:arabinofuranan 3-O-arabinosyltransferase
VIHRRAVTPVLALAAYGLALLQRPGELAADTKIDLHTGAAGFLSDAASAWTSSGGLGQVQIGQYVGYLWPMGPFHALGEALGVAPWLVQRLWLGTLLAIAAWGTVRLLDALLDRERGVAHLAAGALMIANPYVVLFANRTSVTLLAYALLPWLMLAVHRGVREPRGWLWPAALALLVASLGGGVNAAVAAWAIVGPALLLLYEVGFCGIAGRDAARFLARALPLTLLASAWWLVPLAVQVLYGVDFLPFTESAGAIWGSTSMSESLRLMGFWISYLGTGYGTALRPVFETSPTMLLSPLVIVAGFLVPALAFAGFAWTRRWRYGPFFLALALIGLLFMFSGFPEGVPLRRALGFAYERFGVVQIMRTSYKAGPLPALAFACLVGASAGLLWDRLRGRRVLATAAALLGVAIVVAASWPLFEGDAVGDDVSFDRVPEDWRRAAADVDRNLPGGTRALVLPGQVFPYYRWGLTQDPILPALTDRPVAVRGVVPYADLRAVDLLWGTDALVQQRRTLPGQLRPLLDLMGAGQVIAATDDARERSGAIAPALAAAQLRGGAELGRPARRFGAVSRYTVADPGSLVRLHPDDGEVIVDGSAPALAGLAALGSLPRDRAVFYAADLSPARIRAAARRGAEIVISDSNRRRTFVPSQPLQVTGPTLAADEAVPSGASVLDPFERGARAQTVAVYEGARSIRAPLSPFFVQFPEHRPYAAFDGDPSTWWEADRYLETEDRWIDIDLGRSRDVPSLDLLPQRETRTEVREVEIGGRRYALDPGWNHLPVALRDVRTVRVSITDLDEPSSGARGAGAIAEIRMPGVDVGERLRPPRIASDALAGADLAAAPLTFLLERTTADAPFDRAPVPGPDSTSVRRGISQNPSLVARATDPERELARLLDAPAARSYRADGWVSAAPASSRAALERLAGSGGRLRAPCGAAEARVGKAVLRMRPRGRVADLLAGRPVRAAACGPPVALPAGQLRLRSPARLLRADLLRLRSPAPSPVEAATVPGRVIDPGSDGHGQRDGVRLAVVRPGWLVLAESYNHGWRAECDGRDLGKPTPIDGFANGWRVRRGCADASFAFAPQRAVTAGYATSGVACLLLVALLGAIALRRRRTAGAGETVAARGPVAVGERGPLPWRVALAIGATAGLVAGFLFALRVGALVGPALALLLWRGVGASRLALAAAGLAGVVVPAIYLLFPPRDESGLDARYASELLGAHWVAVAAWVLLAVALVSSLPRLSASWRGSRSST